MPALTLVLVQGRSYRWQQLEVSGEVTLWGRAYVTHNPPPLPPSSSTPGAFICAARAVILSLCISVCLAC